MILNHIVTTMHPCLCHSLLFHFTPLQAFQGVYEDASGPEMARLLKEMSNSPGFALNMIVRGTAVVPDDVGKEKSPIMSTLRS